MCYAGSVQAAANMLFTYMAQPEHDRHEATLTSPHPAPPHATLSHPIPPYLVTEPLGFCFHQHSFKAAHSGRQDREVSVLFCSCNGGDSRAALSLS